jgi:hypothetical protein
MLIKYGTKITISVLLFTSFATIFIGYIIAPIISSNTYQQAIAKPSTKSSQDLGNFVAKGKVDSVIYTTAGKWAAKGNWALVVSGGEVKTFNTDMIWNNRTASHTHELRNFETKNHDIGLSPDGSLSIKGKTDVGTNRNMVWLKVPSEIVFEKGKIITISLDDDKTNHHFGGQAIHGTIDSLKRCSIMPGPDMQVPTACA